MGYGRRHRTWVKTGDGASMHHHPYAEWPDPYLTLFATTLLTIAEMIYLRYTQYPSDDLQAGVGGIKYRTFKIMFAIPVLGVIIIRIVEIFQVSQFILLTLCLVVISIMPGEVLVAIMYLVRMERNCMNNSEGEEGNETESPPLPEQIGLSEGHFASAQARLRSILDTMFSVVKNSALLVLFVESVRTVAALVVTPVVKYLEWIMCAVHR
ncbi:hypothetical protein V8B97DRAFT_1926913 [Scleroderma yunnanense]